MQNMDLTDISSIVFGSTSLKLFLRAFQSEL